jgi:hypothetical protein
MLVVEEGVKEGRTVVVWDWEWNFSSACGGKDPHTHPTHTQHTHTTAGFVGGKTA